MVPTENTCLFSPAGFCPNSSSSTHSEVHVAKAVVLGVVLVVFLLFGVLGNILVILSVLLHHQWRSVTHYFIANLAAADLLLSSAVLPFSATSEALGRWVFGRSFCNVWAALDVLCCTASILSLCVISIDRYLAVSYPLRYPAIATGRRGLTASSGLPIYCDSYMRSIFPSCKPPETIFKITFWLGYLNSCINPVIYPCFSQEFKKAFHNMLRGRCIRTAVPAAKQGHITAHSSCPGPASYGSGTSVQNHTAASSLACCRMLSTSTSSVGGQDKTQSGHVQGKGLLKAWCLSARRTSVAQNPSTNGSTKVLCLSLGISGEAV
ncbi:hypothetical protein XENOCAPTIV_020658 [Xenoophorus captivus]|uniref:G-protein coupled receptors family 1 profile domain-containing protein n=1 Tax=Xenoophorus captivus TaxID=1517983 RepID=A0ABV0QNS3_9TELE